MNLQEKQVQDSLRLLDDRLFLDKLYDHEGQYVYYAIRMPMEGGVEPLTCVHWRTSDGPLPLSLDLVDVVRRQEGDIRESIREATINNALKKERAADDWKEDMDERIAWVQKSSKRLGLYGPWSPKYNLP